MAKSDVIRLTRSLRKWIKVFGYGDIRLLFEARSGMLFYDAELTKLFLDDKITPTVIRSALERLRGQIRAARAVLIFPGETQTNETNDVLSPAYNTQPRIFDGWLRLVSDAGLVALALIFALRRQEAEEPTTDHTVLRTQIVLTLRYMLLGRLYTVRAWANWRVVNLDQDDIPKVLPTLKPRSMVRYVRAAVRDYDEQIDQWLVHRRGGNRLPVGWKDAGDRRYYLAWSRDALDLDEGEIGWSTFDQVVSDELRYMSRFALLRQRREETLRSRDFDSFMQWLFLGSNLAANGFGMRLWKLLRFAFGIVLIFTLAYWGDDHWHPGGQWLHCTSTGVFPWEPGIDIYYAVVNSTGLGILRGGPCGPLTGLLIAWNTILGYTLIAYIFQTFYEKASAWIRRLPPVDPTRPATH